MLGQVLEESYAKAQAKQKAEGYIRLERGFATIPLPGIDVPFHSRYLWAGVMPFRACMPHFYSNPSPSLLTKASRPLQEDQPSSAQPRYAHRKICPQSRCQAV